MAWHVKRVCKTIGACMAAMAKILAWLWGKLVVLGDELEVLEDELGTLEDVLGTLEDKLETLGWRGILGINGSVEWTVVDTIDEVVLNKVVFTVSEGMVERLGVAVLKATNSTDCWK